MDNPKPDATTNPLREQHEEPKPHGDKLAQGQQRPERDAESNPPRGSGTGDMDQPGMNPPGEDMPD